MNCRKASSLLSAYIDRELTGSEMLEVDAHVENCPHCGAELEGYRQTKRLLSTLSYQAPRADLEKLLLVEAEKEKNPSLMHRILPAEWTDAMLFRWEGLGNLASPRLRPLAGAALLSLAGLCLATASVNRPGDEQPMGGMPVMHTFTVYVGPTGTLTRIPAAQEISDASLLQRHETQQASMMPIPVGMWQRMATPSLPGAVTTASASSTDWNDDMMLRPQRTRSVASNGQAIIIWTTNR